ncbi:MAG: pyrroline-5-carboxylate reductase family protein [Xanthobacteraceae bacterium]
MKILIVGCGNMGGAMLAGWLANGADPARFTVVDPLLGEAPAGVTLLRALPARQFDAVLIGIKPQGFADLAAALEPVAGPDTTVLSIMAGIDLAALSARFPRAGGVVRVMPNLAAALGKSPIALAGTEANREAIDALMAPLGTPEWFADDSMFDALTALVGSGPAFAYRFLDALAHGAAALGIDPAQAQRLALATVEGAAALAATSGNSPGELAARVTSPGGTTAAGLAVLDADRALEALIAATLRAASDRGSELARGGG